MKICGGLLFVSWRENFHFDKKKKSHLELTVLCFICSHTKTKHNVLLCLLVSNLFWVSRKCPEMVPVGIITAVRKTGRCALRVELFGCSSYSAEDCRSVRAAEADPGDAGTPWLISTLTTHSVLEGRHAPARLNALARSWFSGRSPAEADLCGSRVSDSSSPSKKKWPWVIRVLLLVRLDAEMVLFSVTGSPPGSTTS